MGRGSLSLPQVLDIGKMTGTKLDGCYTRVLYVVKGVSWAMCVKNEELHMEESGVH